MSATAELLQEGVQPQHLIREIERCARTIPLYRQMAGLDQSVRELSSWPMITKEDIRNGFPGNFLGAEANLERLLDENAIELEQTSGTSEERTQLLLPVGWWSQQELRALRLNAFVKRVLRENPEARRVTINSPVCSGDIRYSGVPSRDNRIVGSSLFVSLSRYPFLWSDRDLERMAREVQEWEPVFLEVDPVYGVVFAQYCERQRIRLPSVRFILSSYEFVSVVHRRILERAFGVPILDLYGSTETGHLLMEDEKGHMRPSLETAYLELHGTDGEGIGDLVVTTLSNPIMPLIRYQIGDLAERIDGPYGGRYALHGRSFDAFDLPNGKRVTILQIDRCFIGLGGIAHYQLVQRGSDEWQLRYVAESSGRQSSGLSNLQERLLELLQCEAGVELQQVDMLMPESSGKFRLGYKARKARP